MCPGRNLPKKRKTDSMNVHRNKLSWNSYDRHLLVSMKEKTLWIEIYQKSVTEKPIL